MECHSANGFVQGVEIHAKLYRSGKTERKGTGLYAVVHIV